jgi:hypothetical protein
MCNTSVPASNNTVPSFMQFIARSPSEVRVPSPFTSTLHCSYNANWTCAHKGIQLNSCPSAIPDVLLFTSVAIAEIVANIKSLSFKCTTHTHDQDRCNL